MNVFLHSAVSFRFCVYVLRPRPDYEGALLAINLKRALNLISLIAQEDRAVFFEFSPGYLRLHQGELI